MRILSSCFLLLLPSWEISAQTCELNRIDEFPCNYRNPDTTDMPKENQYGVYSTRITGSPPACGIRRRDHQVKPIQTIGGDPRIKYIFSPGIELENAEDYGNQLFVLYNVSCPANHVAFFNITEIDMEPPNCPVGDENRCVDYVRVNYGGNTGIIESCGTNPGNNQEVLSQGDLEIIFRTSDRNRFPGFRAIVTCIDRSDNRRKRSVEKIDFFDRSLQQHIDYTNNIIRYYRQTGQYALYRRWYPWFFRIESFIIQFGGTFTFSNNKLTIMTGVESEVIEREVVYTLKVLDSEKTLKVFSRSARDHSWKLIVFQGPGTLTVVGCVAFFKQLIVDPRGILPLTEEQRNVVFTLSTMFFDQVLEGPEERLCEEVLNPLPIDPDNIPSDDFDDPADGMISSPGCPLPQEIVNRTCNYTDDTLRLALANRNSDNLLVATIVDVLLSCTERETPGRLEALGMMLAPLAVDCTVVPQGLYTLNVSCTANRAEGVRITGCSVGDPGAQLTVIDRFCQYPSFILPMLETGITPGEKILNLTLEDATGDTVSEEVVFIAPFFVNCTTQFATNSQVDVTCQSNEEMVTIRECVLDERTPLTNCAFPMFMIDTLRLSPGDHSIRLVFTGSQFGPNLNIRLTLNFGVF